jgi:glycosyltransferase involved in cell wall biosynthesis
MWNFLPNYSSFFKTIRFWCGEKLLQNRSDKLEKVNTELQNHGVNKGGNDTNARYAKDNEGKFCVVIPVYNHEKTIAEVAKQALKLNLPVIIVDDGSNDNTYLRLKNIKGIQNLRHMRNLGKGAALLTGFVKAAKAKMNWAITLDADGQHNPIDAVSMMKAIPEGKRPVIIGKRIGMTGENVPWTSQIGRRFSNFWVLLSGGPKMADSQSGFRIYPLPETLNLKIFSKRFQYEVEVLVKAGWKGIPVIEVPIGVNYEPRGKRISHFRPVVDFFRNSITFTWLILQRIFIPLSHRKKL